MFEHGLKWLENKKSKKCFVPGIVPLFNQNQMIPLGFVGEMKYVTLSTKIFKSKMIV